MSQRGFEHSSSDGALTRMKKELGIKNLQKHKPTEAHSTGGQHINIRWKGSKMGTLLSIWCCDDTSGTPILKERWQIRRNYE